MDGHRCDVLVGPLEHRVAEDGSRGENETQVGEIERLSHLEACVLAIGKVRCARPEDGATLRGDAAEQRVGVRIRNRSVVEDDGCPGHERGYEPVVHHPTGGRVEEQAIAGAEIAVERELLPLLEERSAGPVHDTLGEACRARREEDDEGVVEGQLG